MHAYRSAASLQEQPQDELSLLQYVHIDTNDRRECSNVKDCFYIPSTCILISVTIYLLLDLYFSRPIKSVSKLEN